VDLTDICANEHARRAIEIAQAGGHSIQFVGPRESQADDLCRLAREMGLTARAVTPCPCGHLGDPVRVCTCQAQAIVKHRRLFRAQFDLTVEVVIPSAEKIIQWVQRTSPPLDSTSQSLLRAAIMLLHLGPAQVRRVINVAVTIARLAGDTTLQPAYVAEAIQYRPREHNEPLDG